MRIGVIGSAGGSAFAEMYRIVSSHPGKPHRFLVITDRMCGLRTFCETNDIPNWMIEERDNARFSRAARQKFAANGDVDFVLTFFSRLITEDLFLALPAFNVHPGLLPAFKGIGAVRAAWSSKVRFLGATLHKIDASIDGGPIIGQVVMPIGPADSEARLEKYSFIQKAYLGLLFCELVAGGALSTSGAETNVEAPRTDRCNPALSDKHLLKGILDLQEREGVSVVK